MPILNNNNDDNRNDRSRRYLIAGIAILVLIAGGIWLWNTPDTPAPPRKSTFGSHREPPVQVLPDSVVTVPADSDSVAVVKGGVNLYTESFYKRSAHELEAIYRKYSSKINSAKRDGEVDRIAGMEADREAEIKAARERMSRQIERMHPEDLKGTDLEGALDTVCIKAAKKYGRR